jgi:uncharacterized protein
MNQALDEFEWDEAKRTGNLAKHGIDFLDAAKIWTGLVLTQRARHADEERFQSFGLAEGRVVAVIWTWRARKRRLISARIANRGERKDYARCLARSAQTGTGPH